MKKPPVESAAINKPEILIYQREDGLVNLEVKFEDENIWLNQQMMAELFDTTKQNVGLHLKNIFTEGELDPGSVVKESFTTAADGKQYKIMYYNLDAIISVGYRIKSLTATRFRIWATQKLKEYLIKGFILDDERLKNPPGPRSPIADYYDELLERIRDIRASEKRMYLRVRELFALAFDYQPHDHDTQVFFSVMQNKLHYAATGFTAAELIKTRANHLMPNMGLTNWKDGKVRKADTTIAKNYLNESEIDELNRIVVMWLDYAEDQVKRHKKIFLRDWEKKLDEFISFHERETLQGSGSISHELAIRHAEAEYESYNLKRRQYLENQAEASYLEDLRGSVKLVAARRKKK